MHIARLSLICLIAFVFMVGCGLIGKEAGMPETTTAAMEDTAMESDTKMESDMKVEGDMMEAAVEEITLNVTGMT